MGAVDVTDDGLDDAVTPGYTSVIMNYQLTAGGFSNTPIAHSAAANTASGASLSVTLMIMGTTTCFTVVGAEPPS